jgi:hypothetical protein
MNYSETMNGYEVTRKQALAEVAKHHLEASDFLSEMGDDEIYDSCEVMYWLGY